jgi:hypothetical protein
MLSLVRHGRCQVTDSVPICDRGPSTLGQNGARPITRAPDQIPTKCPNEPGVKVQGDRSWV